jgi:hypothetical protein
VLGRSRERWRLYRYEGCNLRPCALWWHHLGRLPRIDRTLALSHIPKTGGTPLWSYLTRHCDATAKLYYRVWVYGTYRHDLARFASLPEPLRRCWSMVSGHGPWGIHHALPQPVDYVTLLRHPVAREISYYRYARDFGRHKDHARIHAERLDALAYLRDRYQVRGRSNVQSSYVMGSTGERPTTSVSRASASRFPTS